MIICEWNYLVVILSAALSSLMETVWPKGISSGAIISRWKLRLRPSWEHRSFAACVQTQDVKIQLHRMRPVRQFGTDCPYKRLIWALFFRASFNYFFKRQRCENSLRQGPTSQTEVILFVKDIQNQKYNTNNIARISNNCRGAPPRSHYPFNLTWTWIYRISCIARCKSFKYLFIQIAENEERGYTKVCRNIFVPKQ